MPQPRTLPTLESILATAEGPLTLQKAGGGGRVGLFGMGLQGEDDVESDEEDEGVGSRHSTIFYWREWLEKFLDSMWVTAFILILLLLDISMFFATTVSGDSNNQSPGWGPEDYITVVVTVSSLVDLSLRQLVQGVRFWEDKLSIAYFLVRNSDLMYLIFSSLCELRIRSLVSLTILLYPGIILPPSRF